MHTIKAEWETFKALLKIAGASDQQIKEARICFYGGIKAIFRVQGLTAQEELTMEDAIRLHNGWLKEINEVADELMSKVSGCAH